MSLVLAYLKKSPYALLFIIVLLSVKVVCDLTLPFYTSQIVNIGIQQGGIEDPIARVISQATLEEIFSVIDDEQRIIIENSYEIEEHAYTEVSYVLKKKQQELIPIFTTAFTSLLSAEHQIITEEHIIARIRTEYEHLGYNLQKLQSSFILSVGLRMIFVSLVSAVSSICVALFSSRVAATLGKSVREDMFVHVLSFNQADMDHFSTASLITRATNDVQQVQNSLVMILRIVVFAPLLAIGGILRVLQTNSSMVWIIALAVLTISSVVLVMFLLVMPRFKRLQTLIDTVNQLVRETLQGIPVIRAFTNQQHERDKFDKANKILTQTGLFVHRSMSAMMPIMMLIMNITAILIVYRGAHAIDTHVMQVGDMMAFIQYGMQIIMSFLMITMLTIMIPRASVSATRIKEVLDKKGSIVQSKDPLSFDEHLTGHIEYRNVGFAYQNAEHKAIKGISFVAKRGTTTAIIGSTGSGKSTILNLLCRFYDATEGTILVDGVDITKVAISSLRKKIGYVPQQAMLLRGSIRSNITYGSSDVSFEDMQEAASIAQAIDFIQERPDAYDDTISQGGTNVSGGQRQRLCIARALARKPEILLFDDSFSALDYQTEYKVRKAMQQSLYNPTIIVVAQRISSILHADTILVLEEGEIVGRGTHSQLVKDCPIYRQIASSQLSQQELESYEN